MAVIFYYTVEETERDMQTVGGSKEDDYQVEVAHLLTKILLDFSNNDNDSNPFKLYIIESQIAAAINYF